MAVSALLGLMARYGLELLGRASAWIAEVDFVVLIREQVSVFLGEGTHALDRRGLGTVGSDVHRLDAQPFAKALDAQSLQCRRRLFVAKLRPAVARVAMISVP